MRWNLDEEPRVENQDSVDEAGEMRLLVDRRTSSAMREETR